MADLLDIADSGNKSVDNKDGDNGSQWLDLDFGSILGGGAALITALKGKTPVTNVYPPPVPTSNSVMPGGLMIWIIIFVVVLLLVMLFMFKNK